MKIEPLTQLRGTQAHASSPDADVWLSASAGTGKTYVLAARVWRLLLRGARPESILCLTFTRAGAAEMADRIHSRLACWARLDDRTLSKEIFALGEDNGPASIARARTLFARVLEGRGGGIRVLTIHAFSQTLLGAFPLEAGLAPGFRAIEGREQAALASRVLSDLATRAEQDGDARLIAALRALSLRLGEDQTRSFLLSAAKALDALEMLTDGIEAKVRRALNLPADFDATHIPNLCRDEVIDRQGLFELGQVLTNWGKKGQSRADEIANWLLGSPEMRARELAKLDLVWNTAKGLPRGGKGQVPTDPAYEPQAGRLRSWCATLLGLQQRAALAADITHALYAARRYARAYADAKRANGFVDFNDLIAKAVMLLTMPGMGAWIGYKLDQVTDHVLVDESQDTNVAQWDIVKSIVAEFWAEHPDHDGRLRTLFTVGDYKQAIFGFQGTDPRHYSRAGEDFETAARDAGRELVRLSLDLSFRSTPPVLDVVDALIGDIGPEALGIAATEPHRSGRVGPGRVMVLAPLKVAEADDEAEGEEGWVPTATRNLAARIAQQVSDWLREPMLLGGKGRALTPGDVMILVRRRSDLAALLVARLQKEGVPVAGIDRLRLASPLVVKDCLAAVRFVLQPDDDLNLAALLVSPIGGWTQEDLYEAAHVPRSGSLWRHLRETVPAGSIQNPRQLLRMADYVSPYAFLETMLSGAIDARRKLLLRLGNEASDPIDELLNAALEYEREGVATLQGFIDWFDRGDGEIVRDSGRSAGAVRVMTVHAAKGLQAPLVILADATADPDAAPDRDFHWIVDEAIAPLPIFRPREAERRLVETLEAWAIASARDAEREHWRLLYVAMTRAEEQLIIAGSLTTRQDIAPEKSWHAAVERAMIAIGAERVTDTRWGNVLSYGSAGSRTAKASLARTVDGVQRPDWLDREPLIEARPPRPLAPSSLGLDDVTDPPPSEAMQKAAGRGVLMHALFERLPGLASPDRREAGAAWLAQSAGIDDDAARAEILDAVMTVLDDRRFAHLFGPEGLAEVPVAGVVDGTVVSGTIDRLMPGTGIVDIVDFKTGRRVPKSPEAIPAHHKRQMSAYAAVLRGVFPETVVRASLLYTAEPRLFVLDQADLDAHKPGLGTAQDILPVTG